MMKLKEIREEKGLSQKELAMKIGVSPTNIYNYEVGRTEPSIEMLKILSNTLDVTVDYLIGNSDDFGLISPAPNSDNLSPDERKLLKAFNSLDVFERDFFLSQITARAERKDVIKK